MKNDSNIHDRYSKGIGYVNQILGILHEISFGQFYFEQALQLRNAKLVNGILCSIEAMYGLTKAQTEKLEKCDKYLFRKIFDSPMSTAIESFYLEMNALPLRFIIVGRRLLFYWTILNKSENDLVKQVYKTQQLLPVKNDWCLTFKEDLKDLDIHQTEDEIMKMKKNVFKTLVSEKIRAAATKYLCDLRNKHSKTSGLKVSNDIQKYLTTTHLSTHEKQILFKLRTRSFNCKGNYSNQYQSLICNFCDNPDYQEHLLNCKSTTKGIDLNGIKYSDIFGKLPEQIKIAKVMKKISDTRDRLTMLPSCVGKPGASS